MFLTDIELELGLGSGGSERTWESSSISRALRLTASWSLTTSSSLLSISSMCATSICSSYEDFVRRSRSLEEMRTIPVLLSHRAITA